MVLDKKECFLSHKKRDHEFYLWELKFLDTFLDLQTFTFASDCGILDFTQKIQESLKTVVDEDKDTEIQDYSSMQIAIWNTKLEFRAKYSFPKIPLSANKVDDDIDIPTPVFVMKFIDAVEQNLNVLLLTNDPRSLLFVPEPKEKIKEVLKELKLLRFFVLFLSQKCIEPQTRNIFFSHVLIVASHAAMVAWLYLPVHGKQSQGLDQSEMNVLLADLLQMKNKFIQPSIPKVYVDVLQALKSNVQSQNEHAVGSGFMETLAHNLVELPTVSNPCQIVGSKDQMAILQEMRNLLRDNLIHLPVLDLEFPCQDMDNVIVDAGLLLYSLYDIKEKEDTALLEDVNRALGLDLPSNIQPLEEITCLIIRKAFQSNLPRIHGLGIVDFLLNNLKEFQGRYSDSLAPIMNQLQIIQKELESTQPFLKDVAEEQRNKNQELQQWATQLIGKAYEVEYAIDSCIRKEVPQRCLEHWLSNIIDEITLIRAEVEIQERKMLNSVTHDTMDTATAQMSSQSAKTLRMNEEIVGFEDLRDELRDKLIKGCRKLDVISIVGMPGLGKTTLAYKLYSDNSVISHFDIRAQCCVSQVYERMDLLLAILHDVIGVKENFSSEADAAEMLRRTLLAKRYLILVDDVWDASVWDDLRLCFHDGKNGSRIILTTRHHHVSKYAKSVSEPMHLRMFNVDESWKLLKDKVFGKESFSSPPLEEVGKYIAEKCGGLPLSIVLVAGILAKMERTEESWKQVATVLGSYIHRDSKAIVEQSYRDLPCHLKACFLYFGAFLEDRVIDALMLKRLWISEGFIKGCEGKSLEDIAEGYLENLIARNLVMIFKRSYLDGKVEECRLHDVLLEFCKKRAAEENFLRSIKWDPNSYSGKQHSQPPRLAFCKMDTLVKWRSSCSFVGSVLVCQDTTYEKITISSILQNFKFLKVLDLENIVVIDYFPTDLVHLRYFSAESYEGSIPSSISNLWNLETLILKSGYMMSVPATVCKMVRLRHLHISLCRLFPRQNAKELHEDSSKLHNLRTLSTPCFSCIEDAELILRKTPNLLELKFHIDENWSHKSRSLVFPKQLETLYIYCGFFVDHIRVRISAPNLKRLTLHYGELDLEYLSHIGHELQNLQALEMEQVKFRQPKWEVSDDEFSQLKVLKLKFSCDLKEWTVSDDAFPKLERLVLYGCDELKGIPICFTDISTLKYMEVKYCSKSVEKSARDIRETKFEVYQNVDFELLIK